MTGTRDAHHPDAPQAEHPRPRRQTEIWGVFSSRGIVLPPLRRRFGRYRTRDVDELLRELADQLRRWEASQEKHIGEQVSEAVLRARRDLERLAREARDTVAGAEADLARIRLKMEELAWMPPVPGNDQ